MFARFLDIFRIAFDILPVLLGRSAISILLV